jgi:pimeloyl-ACP methyl ester carboxylesterase
MATAFDVQGSGEAVVLIHAGIADRRMWEPQWDVLCEHRRVVRLDLAGFGETPIDHLPLTYALDVAALLDELGIAAAAFVGASLGGRVVLELAVARPALVRALVVAAPGLPGLDWSREVREYGAAEDEAVSRGDLARATELNLRMWLDRPGRPPGAVAPALRTSLAEMQRQALEQQAPHWPQLHEQPLAPDVGERLAEIAAPALVLCGDEDVEDMRALARRVASEIPGARHVPIPGAAHLPSLEQPAAFNAHTLAFLRSAPG